LRGSGFWVQRLVNRRQMLEVKGQILVIADFGMLRSAKGMNHAILTPDHLTFEPLNAEPLNLI